MGLGCFLPKPTKNQSPQLGEKIGGVGRWERTCQPPFHLTVYVCFSFFFWLDVLGVVLVCKFIIIFFFFKLLHINY